MIFELKVTLRDVGVPVWRKIQVDSRTSFSELHKVLQIVFDWTNSHLHTFFLRKTNGQPMDGVILSNDDNQEDFPGWGETYDEKEEVLAYWFRKTNDKVLYVYDFGDDWQHEMVLLRKMVEEKSGIYPRCVEAENRTPEEDSRMEVIEGTVDLTHAEPRKLCQTINSMLREKLQGAETEDTKNNRDTANDNWENVLLRAKEFQKTKPWNEMNDQQIFAVVDPVTKERLYISVMGSAGETFGLAVYIGEQGYCSLMKLVDNEVPDLDAVFNQRCVLITFEDRNDLEKADYEWIKSFSIPFRGRKAWPVFRSFLPGYVPWPLNDEEVRLLLMALEQVLEVFPRIKNGMKIPDMFQDGQVFARVPEVANDEVTAFTDQNIVLEGADMPMESEEVPLTIAELDRRRMKKLGKLPAVTVEFSIQHLAMAVPPEDGARPMFPLIAIGVDHDGGPIVYQNLLHTDADIRTWQHELVHLLSALDGVPETILMDQTTLARMKPVVEDLGLHVEEEMSLELIDDILDELEREQ